MTVKGDGFTVKLKTLTLLQYICREKLKHLKANSAHEIA